MEIRFRAEKKKPLITRHGVFMSANHFVLTEEELKKARKELGETEEKRKRSIRELRSKLADDKDENYRNDDDYLLRYLRVRKFDCSKAFQTIKTAYSFKRTHLSKSVPPNIESLVNRNILVYLPYTDEKGNVLFYMDLEKWNLRETPVSDFSEIVSAVCDLISMNPKCQVNGGIGIWDTKALSVQHVAAVVKEFGVGTTCFILQSCIPWRVSNVFVVNTSRTVRLFYKMIQPFMSNKVSERINLLGSDLKELHQHVNPNLLPKKLGGTLEEDQFSVTQNVLDNIPYLEYERSFFQ